MFPVGSPAIVLAIALIAACARQPGGAAPAPAAADDMVPLTVENRTPSTVRVYARFSGGDYFLGRVPPLSEAALELPRRAGSSFHLLARPAVQTDPNLQHLSERIELASGVGMSWRLHASPGSTSLLRLSTVRILPCGSQTP